MVVNLFSVQGEHILTTVGLINMHCKPSEHTSFGASVTAWSSWYLRRVGIVQLRYVQWIHKLERQIKTATVKSYFVSLNCICVNLL